MFFMYNRIGALCSNLNKMFLISLIFPISLFSKEIEPEIMVENYEYVSDYFKNFNETCSFKEAIEIIVKFRNSIIEKGCEVPELTTLIMQYKKSFEETGIQISDEEYEMIYSEFLKYEIKDTTGIDLKTDLAKKHKHKHKHKHKEKEKKEAIELNSKTTFGFLKCIVGGLICIVPFSGAQVVGGALVVSGINDMLDGAREQGDKNLSGAQKRHQELMNQPKQS